MEKISGTGWAALIVATLAAIVAVIEKIQTQQQRIELQRKATFKRYGGLDDLAAATWYTKAIIGDIADEIDNRPDLIKLAIEQLKLVKMTISQSLQVYSGELTREERLMAEKLLLNITLTLNGYQSAKPRISSERLTQLAVQAHEAIIVFCQSIQEYQRKCAFYLRFNPNK